MKTATIILLLLIMPTVIAFDTNDTQQLKDVITTPINNTITQKTVSIISAINNINLTITDNATIHISEEQLETLIRETKQAINNTYDECAVSPFIKQAEKGNNITFQKTLEQAMDNIMDTNFIDQQAWMRETLLPNQEQITELREDKNSLQNELSLCKNTVDKINITLNAQIQTKNAEIEASNSDGKLYLWMMLLAAILIIAVMIPNLKAWFGRGN